MVQMTNEELLAGLASRLAERSIVTMDDFTFEFGPDNYYCYITSKATGQKMQSTVKLWLCIDQAGKPIPDFHYTVIACELERLNKTS